MATAPKTAPKLNIRDRIKTIAAQSAPSMVPVTDVPAPPEKEEEVIPDIASLIADRKARLEAIRLANRVGELGQQVAPLTKEKKSLVVKLKKILGTFKVGKALVGDWRVNYYNSPRETLSSEKLIQALLKRGFQPAEITRIIEESTTSKDSYTLRVQLATEDEGEEEG